MGIFVRAVITGFGFTLGAALFKKLAKDLGLEDPRPAAAEATPPVAGDGGASDGGGGERDPGDGGEPAFAS